MTNEIDLEIINETLIDKLFDVFEKDLGHIYSQEFIDKLNEYLKDENITISFHKTEKTSVFANVESNKENTGYDIYINIPIKTNRTDEQIDQDVLRTMIHEVTHILTNYKIPDFALQKFPNSTFNVYRRLTTRNVVNHTYDIRTYKLIDLEKYLDYVLHIREKSSFATTVALSCYFDLSGPKRNPRDLFNSNFQIIKEYLENRISYYTLNNHMSQIDGDAIELFLMQFAVMALRKNGKIYKLYQYQLTSFLKLCIKYWKRLNKLFGERS